MVSLSKDTSVNSGTLTTKDGLSPVATADAYAEADFNELAASVVAIEDPYERMNAFMEFVSKTEYVTYDAHDSGNETLASIHKVAAAYLKPDSIDIVTTEGNTVSFGEDLEVSLADANGRKLKFFHKKAWKSVTKVANTVATGVVNTANTVANAVVNTANQIAKETEDFAKSVGNKAFSLLQQGYNAAKAEINSCLTTIQKGDLKCLKYVPCLSIASGQNINDFGDSRITQTLLDTVKNEVDQCFTKPDVKLCYKYAGCVGKLF